VTVLISSFILVAFANGPVDIQQEGPKLPKPVISIVSPSENRTFHKGDTVKFTFDLAGHGGSSSSVENIRFGLNAPLDVFKKGSLQITGSNWHKTNSSLCFNNEIDGCVVGSDMKGRHLNTTTNPCILSNVDICAQVSNPRLSTKITITGIINTNKRHHVSFTGTEILISAPFQINSSPVETITPTVPVETITPTVSVETITPTVPVETITPTPDSVMLTSGISVNPMTQNAILVPLRPAALDIAAAPQTVIDFVSSSASGMFFTGPPAEMPLSATTGAGAVVSAASGAGASGAGATDAGTTGATSVAPVADAGTTGAGTTSATTTSATTTSPVTPSVSSLPGTGGGPPLQ
jgi:hypothetical protein